jgi:hypothetical protein
MVLNYVHLLAATSARNWHCTLGTNFGGFMLPELATQVYDLYRPLPSLTVSVTVSYVLTFVCGVVSVNHHSLEWIVLPS